MLNRRRFLASTAGVTGSLLLPSHLLAQSGIRLEKLNYFEIRVTDPGRSLSFYQGLFGMPVQFRSSDDRIFMKIGDSRQYMAVRQAGSNEAPAITQLGYSVSNYDPDSNLAALKAGGFREIDAPDIALPGIESPMCTWVQVRGDDTPTLYFSDERGLIVQLTDTSWCGGTGPLGSECGAPEAVPPGLITLGKINHFTSFVNDGAAANVFYQDFFDLDIQAFQGPGAPVTGIGDGKQFVMYAGGPSAGKVPANIHHVSFNFDGFSVDDVLQKFEQRGITARGERQLGPLMHYISLRMPARGGVEGGTPEVYFTDPDGILMQLQDSVYCGGGGYLGDKCLL